MELSSFSVQEVVAKLVASFRSTASQKSVLLTRSISPDVPEKIVGDRFRIETVIAHLLSNAIKFSPNGSSVQIIVSTSFGMLFLGCVSEESSEELK